MKKLILHIWFAITIFLSLGFTSVFAQDYKPSLIPKPDNLPGPVITESNQDQQRAVFGERLLPRFAIGFIGFVGAASVIFLVIGGVRYAMLYGNEEGVEKAKNQVVYAIVGLLVALLSYTIVTIVSNLDFSKGTNTPAPASSGPLIEE